MSCDTKIEGGGLNVILGGDFGFGFNEEGVAGGEKSFDVGVDVCIIDVALKRYSK